MTVVAPTFVQQENHQLMGSKVKQGALDGFVWTHVNPTWSYTYGDVLVNNRKGS